MPEPLEREGSVWKIRAPVEAFVRLGALITKSDLDLLTSVAAVVFSEIDTALDLPASERPYAALKGKKMQHSEWLRDGLATTLLHIAVLHREARLNVTGVDPQGFVNRLVGGLPGLKDNARLLISLERQLPWLMEAAPHPLLGALEHLLEGSGSGILPIFEEHDTLFPSSSHTHLLWALESLAWDPEFLLRVSLDLAKLARIDPGGRLRNRPIACLNAIFKAWMPQTHASLGQRLVAIDKVIETEPPIGWELVLSLLPTTLPDSGMPTPKPRVREAGASENEVLTRGLVGRTYGEIIDRAIKMAHGDPDRLLALIRAMNGFRHEEMERVCNEAEAILNQVPADQQLMLWTALRAVVNLHSTHREAEWALPATIVSTTGLTAGLAAAVSGERG